MLDPEHIGSKLRKMVDQDGCDPVKFIESVCKSYNKWNTYLSKPDFVQPSIIANQNQIVSFSPPIIDHKSSKFFTVNCKYFELGYCKLGNKCTYKHENQVKPKLYSELPSKRCYQSRSPKNKPYISNSPINSPSTSELSGEVFRFDDTPIIRFGFSQPTNSSFVSELPPKNELVQAINMSTTSELSAKSGFTFGDKPSINLSASEPLAKGGFTFGDKPSIYPPTIEPQAKNVFKFGDKPSICPPTSEPQVKGGFTFGDKPSICPPTSEPQVKNVFKFGDKPSNSLSKRQLNESLIDFINKKSKFEIN